MFTTSTDVGWGWLTLVWLVYFLSLEALFGATVGKWAVRLRVTDRAGRRPPLRHLVVRDVARVVDALPVGYVLGGGVAVLSPWRQRLGDHLADTVVLPQEAVAAPRLRQLNCAGVFCWLAWSCSSASPSAPRSSTTAGPHSSCTAW